MTSVQIACFFAAAEAKSFSEAAEAMYMTQPTFGRHISSLERELGFPLFIRKWKDYRLTDAGRLMLEGFQRISGEYDRFLAGARALVNGCSGSISIGLLEGQLLDENLRRILKDFRAEYPGIEFSIRRYTFHSMLSAVLSGDLDVGVTLSLDVAGRAVFCSKPLYKLENELVMPIENPLVLKNELTLRDFRNETFIEVDKTESDVISRLMRQSCLDAGFEPKIYKVADLREEMSALEAGMGISAFNQYHMMYNHPDLIHIPVPDLPEVEFSAVWKEPMDNQAAVLFTAFLCSAPAGQYEK